MNKGGSEGDLPGFAKDILLYLSDHQDAADTVQGIHQWWLHQTWADCGTTQVQKALDSLVGRGWLTETKIPAPKLYRINEARKAEIKSFLSERRVDAARSRRHSG